MATKKTPSSKSKAKPQARTSSASGQRLQNLAARPSYDDLLDEQLVDHSGVFRVTSAISQAQTGHDDDSVPRFANESLAIAAQRDGVPDVEPTIDEAVEERTVDDEALRVEKRARLATLAARNAARNRNRR